MSKKGKAKPRCGHIMRMGGPCELRKGHKGPHYNTIKSEADRDG